MALPINPTPILDEEESKRFLLKVAAEITIPSYKNGDPDRLEQARIKAMENVIQRLNAARTNKYKI
jgi:hypothetical protein